jgi:iron complex outermembrane recepter protein
VRDANGRDSDGGRLAALWRPSEYFSLKLSAIIQHSVKLGNDHVDMSPGAGELTYDALRGTGFFDRNTQAYSATMTGKLGVFELTSLTGYSVDEIDARGDVSAPAYGGFFSDQAFTYFGVTSATTPEHEEVKKFTQEIRASVPIGQKINWLMGAFYTSEDSHALIEYAAADSTTGARVGTLLTIDLPTTVDEYAAFSNIDFDVTDRFDVQLGARLSKIKQAALDNVRSGPLAPIFYGSDPSVVPGRTSKDTAATYLVTPRVRISPDLMVYGRVASGYRPGGPNASFGIPGVPRQFNHDTTQNYEIGAKGNIFGHALSFDVSAYYIDWKDIQLLLSVPAGNNSYLDNVGRAKSQGVELSVEANPVEGLIIAIWAAWNDATLSDPFPPNGGGAAAGSKLPFSSPWSGNVSVDQEFPLGRGMMGGMLMGSVGASASYIDDRAGFIAGQPQFLPAYVQADLRAGVEYDSWAVNAFVNNVADKRGVLAGIPGVSTAIVFIQPRTFGLSVAKEF